VEVDREAGDAAVAVEALRLTSLNISIFLSTQNYFARESEKYEKIRECRKVCNEYTEKIKRDLAFIHMHMDFKIKNFPHAYVLVLSGSTFTP
jgi:mRNA deadenylase 3'-5' endonuclease subunit Ccr4